MVDESSGDDSSVASISPATMETLGLFRGDTIIVRGKKRKDTGACYVLRTAVYGRGYHSRGRSREALVELVDLLTLGQS